MSTGIWVAASGAAAQITALDATANNLANATTPGFKAEQAVFREHLARAVAGAGEADMRYASVAEVAADTRSGPLRVTQRPLDVAIDGDGFFVVRTPAGERFTRAGALQVGPSGVLVTAQGHALIDPVGNPIRVPPDAYDIRIGEDGIIRDRDDDIGQLAVVRFDDPRGLTKEGEQLFAATPRAGSRRPVLARLHAGALEMPNVSIVKGMTDLVSATRAFEALERAVEAFSQLEQRAATDIVGAR